MTNSPAFTANATLPKPVAKNTSVNFTAPAEAEERSQLKNNSRTSAETAAATASATASLSAIDDRTTTVPTADAISTAASAETASPSRAAAGEKASLSTTYATTPVGGVPEPAPKNDDKPYRTTAKKEATTPPSTTETPTGAFANSNVMAEGAVEELTSPRSRPLKRPIPTPRYVLQYRFLKKKIIARIILWGTRFERGSRFYAVVVICSILPLTSAMGQAGFVPDTKREERLRERGTGNIQA
jgi:hypothetical protein